MKITLINGANGDPKWEPFNHAIDSIQQSLINQSHQVELFTVKDMNFNYCCGCWDCWSKTPGICRFKDDGEKYLKSMAHSDRSVFFSPLMTGFISKETKKALDRFIPNALPFIKMEKGECLHLPRYDKDPELSLFIFNDGDLDSRALPIVEENMNRIRRNMRAKQSGLSFLNAERTEEVVNEISRS